MLKSTMARLALTSLIVSAMMSMNAPTTQGGRGRQAQAQIPTTVIYNESALAAWTALHSALFTDPFDPLSVRLDLDNEISNTGSYTGSYSGSYTGSNQSGLPVIFDVMTYGQVDISAIGLSPVELQQALDENLTWAVVEAIVSTANGSISVSGLALSRQNAQVPFESVFVPQEVLANGLNSTSRQADGRPFCFHYILLAISCNADPAACDMECMLDYDLAIQTALDAANGLRTTEYDRTEAVNGLIRGSHATSVAAALTTYKSEVIECVHGDAVDAGTGLPQTGIKALDWLGFIVTMIQEITSEDCRGIAAAKKDGSIMHADQLQKTGLANEQASLQGKLDVIAADLKEKNEELQDELEECSDDCYEICYILICLL